MIILIWVVALTAALVLYFRQVYSRFSSHAVQHLPVVPFVGNMLNILLRIEHLADDFERTYKAFPNERFIGRYEFIKPSIILRDLDLIKKIAIKDFDNFVDHRGFSDEEVEPLFARNLFSLKGEEWKDMRSTLSPAFTSSKIRLMVPFMEEVGKQMISALQKDIRESDEKYLEIDCKDLTMRFANDVIASCAFGLKVDSHTDRDNKFFEMGKSASTFKFRQLLMFFINAIFPTVGKWLKLTLLSDETKQFFLRLVLDTMNDRESRNIIRPDMIHILMEVKKGQLVHDEKESKNTFGDAGFATVEESALGKKINERVWSDNDLVAQALIFFIAGFDTISTAMSFTLHELALHPDVQKRLAQEIKENNEKNGGKLDYNSIQSLPYMDMVVSEGLRLWPPGLILDRVCTREYNLGRPNNKATSDYIMRKGEVVYIPAWAIHRDPQYFPDPDKFDPERFSDENKHLIKAMTYLPFGLGPRNCIGSRFALCELKFLIYQIVGHMELSLSSKTQLLSRLSTDSLTPRLKGGHWLRFRARS